MTDEGKGKRCLCNHTGFELAIVKSNPCFKMKFFFLLGVCLLMSSPLSIFVCVFMYVCMWVFASPCTSPDSFDCRQRDSSLGIERVHFTSVCVLWMRGSNEGGVREEREKREKGGRAR